MLNTLRVKLVQVMEQWQFERKHTKYLSPWVFSVPKLLTQQLSLQLTLHLCDDFTPEDDGIFSHAIIFHTSDMVLSHKLLLSLLQRADRELLYFWATWPY